MVACRTGWNPKSWRGYIFTAVCLCVCPAMLVNKIPAKRMNRFGRGFALTALARTLLKFVTLGQRARSKWRNTNFFLHNSLLTPLLCISALLYTIEMKFFVSLKYSLGRFVFKFHKKSYRWWRHCDVIYVFSQQLSISQILLNLETSYFELIHDNITSI